MTYHIDDYHCLGCIKCPARLSFNLFHLHRLASVQRTPNEQFEYDAMRDALQKVVNRMPCGGILLHGINLLQTCQSLDRAKVDAGYENWQELLTILNNVLGMNEQAIRQFVESRGPIQPTLLRKIKQRETSASAKKTSWKAKHVPQLLVMAVMRGFCLPR